MADALLAGVSGMKAHQKMIDVAGNNLANVNTTAYKASRVRFSDLLSETLRDASQPTASVGGSNPQQVGSGVKLASVDRDMSQGSLLTTGQPLDMAIEGAGYFVLNDGQSEVYTRVGAFAVDSEFYLVDPGTGYRVQRIGQEGVDEGFQSASSGDIRVPYDQALPAQATTTVTYNGNLSADQLKPTRNKLRSGLEYTTSSGAGASRENRLSELMEGGGTLVDGDFILINGIRRDGSAVTDVEFETFEDDGAGGRQAKTVGQFLDFMTATFADPADPTDLWSSASINNGEIYLTDLESGYSLADMELSMRADATGALDFPLYFQLEEAGGELTRKTNIEIFDSQGVSHTMSATFVKTTTTNKWDLVLTSITGEVDVTKRRVSGINFLTDGTFGALDDATSGYFLMQFAFDRTTEVTVDVDLGTVGEMNALSQVGGPSTAAPSKQDGYASGWLSSISVSREGLLVGVFSNGARRDIASIKLATFQNPAALVALGGNYFSTSSNSGEPIPTKALSAGAGAVHGGSLEKSNVDVANEFVSLIQAQNGFQANARTIRVSNEMLRELTNLIR
jgi:flagellar hook protein FlgE